MAGYNDPETGYVQGAAGKFTHLGHVTDITNKFDKDATPASGDVPTWNGTVYAPGSGISLSVKSHGAIGDGTTDDTIAIQAALDAGNGARVQLERGKNYLVKNLKINNKDGLIFDGNGAKLTLTGNFGVLTVRPGIEIAGTSSHIQVINHRIVGNGVEADQHGGVFCASGATLSDIRVVSNSITNTTLGISFSAVGSGSLSGLLYEDNDVDTIIGTASGYGYGLHFAANPADATGGAYAPSGLRIIGNRVRNCYRHSIYHALGAGSVIIGNTIRDHRLAIGSTGAILSAINVSRSAEVTVGANTVSNFYGGGIYVGGTSNDVAGPPTTVSRDISVIDNMLIRPLEDIPSIIVGQQTAAIATDYPNGVKIEGNTHFSDQAGVAGFMTIFGGKRCTVSDNHVKITGITTTVSAIRFNGTGEGAGTADYTDDWTFDDTNRFDFTGSSGTCYVYRLSGAEATGTKMVFRTGAVTNATATFVVTSSVSDPNVSVVGLTDGLTLAAGVTLAPVVNAGVVKFTTPSVIPSAFKPAAAQMETFPRHHTTGVGATLVSGTLYLTGIYLPAATVVSAISYVSAATAAITPTNWWFGLYNSSLLQLALTADQTTSAIAANALLSKNIATIASGASGTFTTTYSGLHYVGIMVVAATMPTMQAVSLTNTLIGLSPRLWGTSDTGQTTPPAFPRTVAALAGVGASATPHYAYV